MSRIVVGTFEADFSNLVEVVKGATITSLNLGDDGRTIDFNLSEDLLLQVQGGSADGVFQITVASTLNSDEGPPERLRLIEGGDEPSAALVERRLHNLRQVYAIIFLLNANREDKLAAAVRDDPSVDIERNLLSDQERLYLQAAGPGSWWVTVLTKIRGAGDKALNTLSLLFSEGRGMLLQRVRAGTDLKKEDVVAKRIANDAARIKAVFDITTKLEKIKNMETREMVRQILLSNTSSLNAKSVGIFPSQDSLT